MGMSSLGASGLAQLLLPQPHITTLHNPRVSGGAHQLTIRYAHLVLCAVPLAGACSRQQIALALVLQQPDCAELRHVHCISMFCHPHVPTPPQV